MCSVAGIAVEYVFEAMVVPAIVGGVLFYIIVRMVNAFLASRRIATWLEIEMADIVNTLLLLLFFSSAIAFLTSPSSSALVDDLVRWAYGKGVDQLLAHFPGEVFRRDVCLYENTYNLLALITGELVKVREAATWAKALYHLSAQQTITKAGRQAVGEVLGGLPAPPGGPVVGASVYYSPEREGYLYYNALPTMSLDVAIAFIMFNIMAFILLAVKLGPFFIPLGFIMRVLPGLKPVGSSLAAIGIAFSIFFPLLLVGEAIVMLADGEPFSYSSVSDEPWLIGNFTTSPTEIMGTATVVAYELGAMGYTPPFVVEGGNITVKRFPPATASKTIFKLPPFLDEAAKLAIYGSLIAPVNFLLIIVMVSSIMRFLGERDTILDFFLLNYM